MRWLYRTRRTPFAGTRTASGSTQTDVAQLDDDQVHGSSVWTTLPCKCARNVPPTALTDAAGPTASVGGMVDGGSFVAPELDNGE